MRVWLTPIAFELSSLLSLWLRLESGVANHRSQGDMFSLQLSRKTEGFQMELEQVSQQGGGKTEFFWLRLRRASGDAEQVSGAVAA